ncbi:MAG: hypothetical protein V5A62_04800 [Haloarculaceae archaeon]
MTLTPAPLPESTATPRDRQVGSRAAERALETPWYERTATTTLSPAGRSVAFHPRPTAVSGLVGGGQFRRPGTTEGPARLALTLVNTAEKTMSVAHDPVTGRLVTPRNDARTFLLPAVGPDDAGRGGPGGGAERGRELVDDCWRGRPTGTGAGHVDVRPGEWGSLVYDLVADPEGPCLPVGTYAFETGFGWTFTLGVWRTDEPGPTTPSRFAGTDVPGLPDDGPTAWFHHADRTTAVYLRPSAERIPLADGAKTLRVAMFNHSSTTLVGNPLAYGLLKLHEGSWYHVVPDQLPSPAGNLPPGAIIEKVFELRHGDRVGREDAVPVGHLGGGRYAVRFGMHRPRRPRQYAALLVLDAPRVELSPAPELRVERPDSARPIGWLDPDGGLFDAIVTATRTDEPADRTVVAEQVMHEPVLRNTIPLFDAEVETVELHTRDPVADRLLRPGETLRVALRGTTYELIRQDD